MLVFRKEEGNTNQGYTNTLEPGIYLMHTDREEAPEKITEEGMFPMFNADASRIYYQNGGYLFGDLTKTLVSVNLRGKTSGRSLHRNMRNALFPVRMTSG